MSDIFGRSEQVFAGGLTSDASYMFWQNLPNGGLGMLITDMRVSYAQPVRRIYEIGPWTSVGGAVGQPVYYIAGRPAGEMDISRIAGPVAAVSGFYRKYGNICSLLNNLVFVSSTGCVGGVIGTPSGNSNPVLTSVGDLSNLGSGSPNTPFGGNVINNQVAAAPGSRFDNRLYWYMNGVTITNLNLGTRAEDMMVAESTHMMFACLKLFIGPADGNGPPIEV